METDSGRSDGSGIWAVDTTTHWREVERISRTSMLDCASRLSVNSLIDDDVEPKLSECSDADGSLDAADCFRDPTSMSSLRGMVSVSPAAREFTKLGTDKPKAIIKEKRVVRLRPSRINLPSVGPPPFPCVGSKDVLA